jgi:hypothetical protein
MEMTMRYMSIVKSSESYRNGPPPQALIDAIGRLGEEATKAGAMVDMGGLAPTAMGFRVRLSSGRLTVTDGPFSEAKEVIGGFAVFSVKSKEEALEWAKRFMNLHKQYWPSWEGEAEVRMMMDAPDCRPQC